MGPALAAAIGIPVVFAALCAGLWAAGVVAPDWETRALMLQIPSAEQLNRAEPLSPSTVVVSYLVLSVVLGPTFFALLFLASEIGWRDYFLSRLLPVGRVRALLLSGLFWGLWLALLGLADPWNELSVGPFLLRQVAFGVAFGAFVGEAWRRSRHVGLAAVITGSLQAQLQGVWFYLFPDSEYLGIGLPATAIWAALALALIAWPEKGLARDDAPSSGAVARG
ncbi:MAG: hypothetical protein GX856_14415 [Gammaproteobacteria bacterium]|nr:hypothetical protein [Gammaproteobacteria bacterium]